MEKEKKGGADITIKNLIMILEIDRLVFKAFNLMVAEQMTNESQRLKDFFDGAPS